MKNPKSLKQALEEVLSAEEMKKLVKSFDIVGSIAIIEIPEELKSKEKEIGEAILKVHKNVKTVCSKEGPRSGEFRIMPLKVIAGEDTTETIYIESGARMKLDVSKVYFSPRLSYERNRIASLVKPGEVIGAWFAGVGPFPLVIFKKQPNVLIYAIELNPAAYKYLVENIRINKAQEAIIPVLGDVAEKVRELPKFDRILMPLPKGALRFLDLAFERIKPGGVIHVYSFVPASDPYSDLEKLIKSTAAKHGKKAEIIFKRKVRSFSPDTIQVAVDIKVEDNKK